jgi:DivIVA domain-containing protein
MPLTPQEVHSKVFGPTRFRRGYDEAEVDAFLDEVEVELTRLHREIDGLRAQLGVDGAAAPSAAAPQLSSGPTADGDAAEPVTPLSKGDVGAGEAARADDSGDLEQRVARTLVLAQRAADEALHDAETQAEQMRLAAQAEVERMRAEAEEAAARERSALERDRTTAQDDVEQLRAFEREYRTRLRAYLELQLRELDGSGSAQVENRPAPALSGESDGIAPGTGPENKEHATVGAVAAAGSDQAGLPTSSGGATEQGFGAAGVAAPESAPGGVSDRAAGEEQGHEPPRDGV